MTERINNKEVTKKNKHTKSALSRTIKLLIAVVGILMFIQTGSIQAQVLNNEGAVIFVESGAVVQGDTLENSSGIIENNGVIGLNGHYLNADTTQGDGTYNIGRDWINSGKFISNSSTVNFVGTQLQEVNTGGDLFNNLGIRNEGSSMATNRIILLSNVTIFNSFNFEQGNVETGDSVIYLVNADSSALNYLSSTGSRVIGYFERGVNTPTDTYLFPVGSFEHYNPLNLYMYNDGFSIGSVLSQFVASDPDTLGLPLPDPGYVIPTDTVEVYDADSTGYWSLTARNTFQTNNFNINLSGSGFRTPYQNATRVIKRAPGGNWTLDGVHRDATDSVIYRDHLTNGIASDTSHFGWGHIRPRIQEQPDDTAVCDGFSAYFRVVSTGRGTLTYNWEVLEGTGTWTPISDDAVYDHSDTDTLIIKAADLSMDGYKYRVLITDSLGNTKHSNAQATLTVNPNPVATATPQQDTVCNGETTNIALSSDVPATTYAVDVIYQGSILGAKSYDEYAGYSSIEDTLVNPTLYADSVIYVITPYGPFATHCEGTNDTVVIWVEPTVEISSVNDTICNGDATNIVLSTDNITTNGIYYTWTARATDPDVSGYSDNPIGQDISVPLVQTLTNTGLDSAIVHYTITPWTLDANGDLKCDGVPITIDIWVEPTVEIVVSNDTICDGTETNILVTSPNTTTNGIRYTWTVVDNPNVTGESNSDMTGQDIGTAIIQTLVNPTDVPQLVQYAIVPWTVNANDMNECTDINEVSIVDIWVNPTPRVEVAVVQDTICNDTYTEIHLTTPTVLTTGNVTFDYTFLADAELTGSSTGNDVPNGYIIADSLHNASDYPATPLVVRYSITPQALPVSCADGPVITDSVTVHPTPDTYMYTDSVQCFGLSNGSVSVLAENGINDFTYNWNDPFNHQTASIDSVLSIGTYTVTVTDNQGCTKLDSVYLGQPDRLYPYYHKDSILDETCFGYMDGYAMVDPSGGNGGYRYVWSTNVNDTTSNNYLIGLEGNLYHVTVIDYKGCAQDTTMQVNSGLEITGTIEYSDVTCNGEDDGWARIVAPGATSFIWNTGQTSQYIDNLSPDTYIVQVANSSGCEQAFSQEISEPDPIIIELDSTDIWCAGDHNGTITIDVTGGNTYAPYMYNWSTFNGEGLVTNDGNQTGLAGGKYYVTVTDDRGCSNNDSISVGEPPVFTANVEYSDITCFGDADGTISIEAQGGNEGFSYLWSNGSTDTLLTDLYEGEYIVTVTDEKGCEIYDTINIIEPELLETVISGNDINCFGFNDGSATLDIFGGTTPYSINWDNNPSGQGTDSIYELSPGTYYVTVIDDHNCITDNFIEIIEPEQLINNVSFENITCYGYNNGEIVLDPTGGILPYNYQWSHDNSLNNDSAMNLGPGNYEVSVVDYNSCVTVSQVELNQPDPLEATIVKNIISCYGFNDGGFSVTMFGGTPAYNYNWSNGYDEAIQTMMPPGEYHLQITDQLGCYIDTTLNLIEPDKLVINPLIRRPTCADIQDGSIELNIAGGRTPYSVYWDNGSSEENLYDIRSGIFDVIINDSSLCEIDTSFRVTSAHSICFDIPTAFTPNGDSHNEKWEIDLKGLYPQAEIEIFDRYGRRVFYSKGYDESQYWDGTYNGKELPMDAYYYVINLKNGDDRISGVVTIVR